MCAVHMLSLYQVSLRFSIFYGCHLYNSNHCLTHTELYHEADIGTRSMKHISFQPHPDCMFIWLLGFMAFLQGRRGVFTHSFKLSFVTELKLCVRGYCNKVELYVIHPECVIGPISAWRRAVPVRRLLLFNGTSTWVYGGLREWKEMSCLKSGFIDVKYKD